MKIFTLWSATSIGHCACFAIRLEIFAHPYLAHPNCPKVFALFTMAYTQLVP